MLPVDVGNRALDSIGYPFTMGDLQEGTEAANICLRAYGPALRQLLRAANWNFARKCAPMNLLADATGQTANVGTKVVVPWIYEYSLPLDSMKIRFVPANPWQEPVPVTGNISLPEVPLTTGFNAAPWIGQRLVPARFLVATDFNYPPAAGADVSSIQGVSYQSSTVVLTNVKCAQVVYTALITAPQVWDPGFQEAMVAYLAQQIALPVWAKKDRKFGIEVRTQQIAIAKAKIMQARVDDGREGHYAANLSVDWMRVRNSGGWGYGYGGWGGPGELGVLGYGWDSCGFADGTAY